MLRIIALLLLIPLLDAIMLVVFAGYLGWQLVVLLVVLTALVGLLLVRAEGRHTLRRIQQKALRGDLPANEMLDGALIVAAGAFLLTPGLVTDAVGFLLVLPVTRVPVRMALKKWVVTPYVDRKTGGVATGSVWLGGFPDEDDSHGGSVVGGDPPGDDGFAGETVDLGEDAYDVEDDPQ